MGQFWVYKLGKVTLVLVMSNNGQLKSEFLRAKNGHELMANLWFYFDCLGCIYSTCTYVSIWLLRCMSIQFLWLVRFFLLDNISMHVAQNCIGYDFLDDWAGPNGCFCAGSIPEIWKIWAWLSGHFTWLSTSPSQTSWIPNSICGGSPQGELKPVSAHCFGDSCGVGGHWVFSVQSEDSNPFR